MSDKIEKILQNVTDHLRLDERLDASRISIDYHEGTIKLNGLVPTMEARNVAEADIVQLEGVEQVENNLQIEPSGKPEIPSDEELKKKIKDTIYFNNQLDYSKIDVVVNKGKVTLIGSVDSYSHKSILDELISRIEGVVSVIDEVSVVPSENLTDRSLAQEILDVLQDNQLISDDLKIQVENGRVTISGTVANWNLNNQIYKTVARVDGVAEIINELIVSQK